MFTIRIIFILFVAAALSSCGPAKVPDISSYVISGQALQANRPVSRTNKTLLVATPTASSGYDTSKMIYVQIPYKLRSFATNRWVAPPSQMLMPMIAQSIRNRGYFRAVVTPPYSGNTNYILTVNLLALEQDFYQPTSVVRLVMQATLTNSQTGQVLASRRFVQLSRAPENNPYSGVLATNRAAAKISREIAAFVLRHS